MKFALSTVLIAAAAFGAVAAQDTTSSESASSMEPSSTPAPSSSSSSSMPSSAASGSSSAAGGAAGSPATCVLVSGDPKNQPFGCPEGAVTSTPPYDASSLQSFLIGAYTPGGKEGYPFSEVAADLADRVTELYPTLTQSYSAIVSQYEMALEASATNFQRDAAPVQFHLPSGLAAVAAVGVALVAGGAFVL